MEKLAEPTRLDIQQECVTREVWQSIDSACLKVETALNLSRGAARRKKGQTFEAAIKELKEAVDEIGRDYTPSRQTRTDMVSLNRRTRQRITQVLLLIAQLSTNSELDNRGHIVMHDGNATGVREIESGNGPSAKGGIEQHDGTEESKMDKIITQCRMLADELDPPLWEGSSPWIPDQKVAPLPSFAEFAQGPIVDIEADNEEATRRELERFAQMSLQDGYKDDSMDLPSTAEELLRLVDEKIKQASAQKK